MKILVFQQTGLPVSEGYGDVLEKLSQKAELQFVDTKGIMSGQFSGDYFFNAHGEYYPMEIEDSLFSFFAQGGGLLHIGGMPFEKAMVCENGASEITRDTAACRCQWIFFGLDLVLLHIPPLMRTFLWIGSKPLIRRLWET